MLHMLSLGHPEGWRQRKNFEDYQFRGEFGLGKGYHEEKIQVTHNPAIVVSGNAGPPGDSPCG